VGLIAAMVGIVALTGCNGGGENKPPPSTTSQIQAIKDNPNIPPQAKMQAEYAASQSKNMGQYMQRH
jgi:hypothetical protein